MGTLYVAASKALQDWAGDVGLGKLVFKVGLTMDRTPEEEVAGLAGQTDWKILQTAETDTESTEEMLVERLGRKEKLVDPNYYPKLRGASGIVKVSLANVENSMLLAIALDNREPPKNFKVKPADIAQYLLRNLAK
jgi:hypothetical protein